VCDKMEDDSASPPMDQDTDQMSSMQDSGSLPVKQSAFDQLTSEPTDQSGVANGNNGTNQDDFQMGEMEGSNNPDQEGDNNAQEMQDEPAPSAPKDSGGDLFGGLISNFQAVKKDKPPTPPPAEDDDDDEDSKDEPEKKKDLFDSVFDAKEESSEKKDVFDGMSDSGDDANNDDDGGGNESFGEAKDSPDSLVKISQKVLDEKDSLVKDQQNFVEENISEAFKTLEVYQKALETERTRCIKTVKEGMSVDTATSITRKLRKLYAVTQKNMDLLDRAIVESFVENFPTESTRIHMGRMKPTDPASMTVNPTKPKPAKRSKKKTKGKAAKGKGKIKIKGKPGPKKTPAKKNAIKINGSATYVDYDDDDVVRPSLKKRPAKFDDSDVELVESEDDYYPQRSKPGPASKKPKMGPKSRIN